VMSVKYLVCPQCGAATEGTSPSCSNCGKKYYGEDGKLLPEIQAAIQAGRMRVISQVTFPLKAKLDGTGDTALIRPEHIAYFDVVPKDSPTYTRWSSNVEADRKRVEILREQRAEKNREQGGSGGSGSSFKLVP